MEKAKDGLGRIIKLAEKEVHRAKSWYMAQVLAEAKSQKTQIVKETTRVELIVDNNEDLDGKPVTLTSLQAFLPHCKSLMDACLATTKSLSAEYRKVVPTPGQLANEAGA